MHDGPENRLPNVGKMQNDAHKMVAAVSYPSYPANFAASTKMRQDQCRPSQARLPARQSGSQNTQVRKFSDMDPNISRTKKVSSLVNYFTCPFGHAICRLGRVEDKADTKHPTLWIQGKALLIGSHGFGELAEFGRLVGTTFQVSYDVEYVKIRKGKCIKTKNSSPSPQP